MTTALQAIHFFFQITQRKSRATQFLMYSSYDIVLCTASEQVCYSHPCTSYMVWFRCFISVEFYLFGSKSLIMSSENQWNSHRFEVFFSPSLILLLYFSFPSKRFFLSVFSLQFTVLRFSVCIQDSFPKIIVPLKG